MSTVAATRRIDRGRGHYYLLDGERADGITKVINDGVPKPNLIGWAANTTAGYAVDHWDELAELKLSERLEVLKRSRFEGLREAGVRGVDIHKLVQRHLLGEEVAEAEPLRGHMDAYERFLEQWSVEELLTEVVVGNRRFRYMGTLDLICGLSDGQRWLLDWKTGASGIWPESALQLAAYRYAEFYLDADGDEQPMPTVDASGCIWLRTDGYDLVPVEAGPDSFRTFLYAQQVAAFTQQPREAVVGEALEVPA